MATMTMRGRSFETADSPVIRAAAAEFASGFEEGTLRFFDAALARCDRFIDFGAYAGFTSLYAASAGATVRAFEPTPANRALLVANLAANPALAQRIQVFGHGIGACDAEVPVFSKGTTDSGTSVFQDVERGAVLRARPEAVIRLRSAEAVLRESGLNAATLLKIDIEGAEYEVLPAIAAPLAEHRPFLHVSFHPFNLVVAGDTYRSTLWRLRAGLAAAEALACYRFMHIFDAGAWTSFGADDRMDVLRHYLLRAKPVSGIATPQYGFVDGIAFSDQPLVALRDRVTPIPR